LESPLSLDLSGKTDQNDQLPTETAKCA
jgi:hypothetical protein